jgi:hypothetical protein
VKQHKRTAGGNAIFNARFILGPRANLETRACNPLRRLAEALGNTSESRALIGCFSSANYYSNFEPYLVIQISNIVQNLYKFYFSLCIMFKHINETHSITLINLLSFPSFSYEFEIKRLFWYWYANNKIRITTVQHYHIRSWYKAVAYNI